MLKNPILKDMSIDDLNQRYRDTYVLYNQVPYYTYGFRKSTMRGVRVDINLCSLAELHNGDNGGWKGFNWELLDVSRPEAGWYSLNGVLTHVSYLMNKQYSRGVCQANTYLRVMSGAGPNTADFFDLLTQQLGQRKQFPKKSMESIKVEHQTQGFSILNRQVSIHLRTVRVNMQQVGKLSVDLDAFVMTRPMYKVEIEDRVLDPVFKEADPTKEKVADFDVIIKELKMRKIAMPPKPAPLAMDELDRILERHQQAGPPQPEMDF